MKYVFLILILLAAISNGFSQTFIRMYSAPSTTSQLIEIITEGTKIKIIDSSISYYHKIEYDGKTGFISKSTWTKYLNETSISSQGGSNGINSLKSPTPSKPKASSKNYIRGPKGGCYYINSSGNKTYVDRSLCN